MLTDAEEVTRGADLTGIAPKLPEDVEPECVAQTLYESAISDGAMDLLRDLGSKAHQVVPFTFSSDDSEKIANALEAAAGYCRSPETQ
ncbi:hypothetical protein [Aeromicrobium fastidiosum]|uniref:Uncharacterized protein n=1 Tax=Aeromicrobium fastidiosum TaxID=52699 RepID=A0A641AUY0_9ACTN|nr:hypothetical protein [Aeromicrobium fastidiosum]KAA1380791.1 hypothetical protein ESP62_006420 [Aeromicrobium fastidiosum]MBP2390414.1 hypothetical protein [Aeromicrobium fastidiosum]